jgi:hypothetical protein
MTTTLAYIKEWQQALQNEIVHLNLASIIIFSAYS